MLLAGVVTGRLALRDVATREDPPLLSLDHLVNEYRKTRLPELARVAVVQEHRDDDIVLGFNSPLTLLCPTPIENDERREIAWGALWQALTGSERPRDWRTEAMGEWRPAGLAVRQIRTWIERLKRLRSGAAPPWTQAFADHSVPAPATFGRGRTLSVRWGTGIEAAPFTIALPTASPDDYWPDADTPRIGQEELPAALASALASVTTNVGVTFESVEFTLPDREGPTRAFWREHLEYLHIRGDIAAFGARADERRLAVLTADHRAAAMLDNVVLLDRDDIMIRDCTPMRQEPVPGSSTRSGRVRYPDLPLRADYLGLVETDDGHRVDDLLKNGETVRPTPPTIDEGPRRPATGGGRSAMNLSRSPRERRAGDATTDTERSATSASTWLKRGYEQAARAADSLISSGQHAAESIAGAVRDGADSVSTGRRAVDTLRRDEPASEAPSRGAGTRRPSAKATWELRLAGRSDRVSITLPVPQVDATDDEAPHRAHWMVWPRFRSTEAPYWRAYYVYEHCTNANLHLSTLWFDPEDDCVRRCAPPARSGAHPVGFTGGDRRGHTGGPPLAFSLENRVSGQELGLYVINLDSLPRRQARVKVGLDFGTSHTVAAVEADGGKHLVELGPELDPARNDALTLHVSENWSHVTDSGDGLKRLGVWLPTYTDDIPPKERQGLLPSELLTIEPLASLGGKDPSSWQPGVDCVIPFMDMQRSDLADYLLSDFKWKVSAAAFREREPVLREIYLGMAMELVMADVVWRRLRALPAQVDFTFTYPLRDSPEQVQGYQRTLRRVIDSGARSLGSTCRLADGIGIYNESSAARGGTLRFGDVCLVGDLGGRHAGPVHLGRAGTRVRVRGGGGQRKARRQRTAAHDGRTRRPVPACELGGPARRPAPVARLDALQGVRAALRRRRAGARAPCRAGCDGFREAEGGTSRTRAARALLPADCRVHGSQPGGLSRPPLVCPSAEEPTRRSRGAPRPGTASG